MRLLVLLTAAAFSLSAQSTPPVTFSSELDKYLLLTREQSIGLAQNAREFGQWSAEKLQRSNVVRSEIAVETAKPQLDAMALGVRYVELEVICREARDKTEELRRKNLGVLSAEQKTKIAALEEAVKQAAGIAPLVREGQLRLLIGGPGLYVDAATSPSFSTNEFAGFLLSGRAVLPGGCAGWNPFVPGLLPSFIEPAPQAVPATSARPYPSTR